MGKLQTKIRQSLGGGFVNPTLFPKSTQILTVLNSSLHLDVNKDVTSFKFVKIVGTAVYVV